MTEKILHKQIVQYIKLQYPNTLFQTDMAGVYLPQGLAVQSAKLRSHKGYPDLFIIEPIKGYSGLFIELKTLKNNPFKINGELAKKANLDQVKMLEMLTNRGFKAVFGIGFLNTKKIIDDYLNCHDGKLEISYKEVELIIKDCAVCFDAPIELIKNKGRLENIVLARQLAQFIIKNRYTVSRYPITFQRVGNIFNQHHASVIHGIKTITNYLEVDRDFKLRVNLLLNKYLKGINY